MPTSMTNSILSFSRVLLATDFSPASQAAFQVALCVCAELRASLSVLHVLEDPYIPSSEPGGQFFELDSIYQTDRRKLDDLREAAQLAGVPCETNMVNGTASLAIMEAIAA